MNAKKKKRYHRTGLDLKPHFHNEFIYVETCNFMRVELSSLSC